MNSKNTTYLTSLWLHVSSERKDNCWHLKQRKANLLTYFDKVYNINTIAYKFLHDNTFFSLAYCPGRAKIFQVVMYKLYSFLLKDCIWAPFSNSIQWVKWGRCKPSFLGTSACAASCIILKEDSWVLQTAAYYGQCPLVNTKQNIRGSTIS